MTVSPAPIPATAPQSPPVPVLPAHALATGDRRAAIAAAVAELPALGPVALTDPYGVHRLTAIWLESRPSAATTAAYFGDLARWLAWCAARGLDPRAARRADADLYRTDLAAAYAAATVARRLAAASSWYGYLVANDAATTNPFAGAERPAIDRDNSTTVALSRDEAAAFLVAAAADPRSIRLRTAALLGLMLTEGLRVAEICGADVADIGHSRGYRTITVTRKGGKRRAYPLAPPIAAALDDYLADRADREGLAVADLSGPLFVTEPSGPHPGGKRLDRWGVSKLIRRIARAAAIPSAAALTPHSLRHTFITLALDAGVALRDVQDAAGHADPRTTRGYDRARFSLDRHPATRLVSYLAEATGR